MDETYGKDGRGLISAPRTIESSSGIVSRLKALYDAIEQEPIPDAFLSLLERLDAVEKAGKT